MSASPKYTSARLSPEQKRRQREAHEALARAQEGRRKAEEQRRQRERLERTQVAGRATAREALEAIESLAGIPAAGQIANQIRTLRAEVATAVRSLDGAAMEADARAAIAALAAVSGTLPRLRAEAEGLHLTAELAREEAAVTLLERKLAAVDGVQSAKFDPGVLPVLNSLTRQAGDALKARKLGESLRLAAEVEQRFGAHLNEVARLSALWSERHGHADAAIAQVSDRLAGLRVGQTASRQVADDLAALEARATGLRAMCEAGRFESVVAESVRIKADTDAFLARAAQAQLKEDEQQHVLKSAIKVLGQMGFHVTAGPTTNQPGSAGETVTIQARHPVGGALAMIIPLEGDIAWNVAGRKVERRAASGRIVRGCPDIERQIGHFATLMKGEGVEVDPPRWEGQDHDGSSAAAKKLPRRSSGDSHSRTIR